MLKKVLIILATLFLIAGGIWYYEKVYLKSTKSNNNQSVSLATSKTKTKENVFFLSQKDSFKEIIKTDFEGVDKETIFNDQDQDLKIKELGGLASLKDEILILAGNDKASGNVLEIIQTDGQKRVILESFENPNVLAISPDGKLIAFVLFSRVEENSGYSLFTMAQDGSNRRQLVRQALEIKGLSWNKDSSGIFYLVTSEGKNEIKFVNIDNPTDKSIYSTDQEISSINFQEAGVIVSQYDKNKATGEIFVLSSSGAKQRVLLTKKGVPLYATISQDNAEIAFLEAELKDGVLDKNAGGEILTATLTGENLQEIGAGFYVLGWLP